jgi:hypothetical protein
LNEAIIMSHSTDTFVRLSHSLLQSPGWKSLRALQRALYIEVASLYNGHNNGRIHYSERDGAKEFHVCPRTIRRSIKRIKAVGLLVCTKRGYFNRATGQTIASEWLLPEYPPDTTVRCLPHLVSIGHHISIGHHTPRVPDTTHPLIDKEIDKKVSKKVSKKEQQIAYKQAYKHEVVSNNFKGNPRKEGQEGKQESQSAPSDSKSAEPLSLLPPNSARPPSHWKGRQEDEATLERYRAANGDGR